MIDMEWLRLAFSLFDRKVRAILSGYRPEVICVVRASDADRYLLIVPARNHSIWIPPQEGMGINDMIEDVVFQCLQTELGFEKRHVQFQRSCWIAKRVLPRERWNERDLTYSLRHIISGHKMIGKAYYAALVFADHTAELKVNRSEVYDYAWVDPDEYKIRILTNPPDKLNIINTAWEKLVPKSGSAAK